MTSDSPRPLRLRDQLIRSFLGVGALRALSMPISLVISIILARSLGPESFGQYVFILALLPLLALPVAGGLPQLLTREVAKYAHAETWDAYRGIRRFAYGWVVSYSALIVVVVWLAFAWAGYATFDEKWQLLPLVALLVPLHAMIGINQGVTKGLGHVAMSEVPKMFIQPAAFLVLIALMALFDWLTPTTAIVGVLIATGIAYVGGARLLSRRRPDASLEAAVAISAKEWMAALLPFSIIAIVGTLNSKTAILLLGFIDTDSSIGAFQVASTGAALVTVSLLLVNMVIAPQIVRFWSEKDTDNLQLLARQSARAAFAFAMPIALAYFVFGEQILHLLFGEEYAKAAFWPLVILSAGHLFNVFAGPVGLLLTMSGYEMDTLRTQGVALVITVGSCALLIPAYGAVGASLGTTLGLVTWNVLLAILVKRRLGIRPTVV